MQTPMLTDGVWGIVATPFTADAAHVDHRSLRTLVQRYEAIGAAGLTVLGVFGEAGSLDTAERSAVLATVRDAVTLPVVAGMTGLSTAPVVEEARRAQDVLGDRLAGAMVQMHDRRARAIEEHFNGIHAATGAGILAQHYPIANGIDVPLPNEVAALSAVTGLVGVKEESPPTAVRVFALSAALGAPVFGGLGGIGLVDELEGGAAGAMTGFSFPEGLLAAVAAHRIGGFDAARAALAPYLPMITFEQQPRIGLAVRKHCLMRRGLIAHATVRPPAPEMPTSLVGLADRHVAAMARQVAA